MITLLAQSRRVWLSLRLADVLLCCEYAADCEAILSNALDESAHRNDAYFQHFKPGRKSTKQQASGLIHM